MLPGLEILAFWGRFYLGKMQVFHFISYQFIDKIYFTIVTLDLRQHIFEQKLEAHDSLPSMRAKICLNIFPHNEKPIEVASNCEIDLI